MKVGFFCSFWLACALFFSSFFLHAADNKTWFSGGMNEAFLKSKKEQKPIFLYWGAKWCPPCNELKSEIFSKDSFKTIIKPFIPVYLDGDSENAQIWGEKLGVRGYPTMLVLNPKGAEVMRIDTQLTFLEFEKALFWSLQKSMPLKEMLLRAKDGKLSDDLWQALSFISFSSIKDPSMTDVEKALLLKDLVVKIPKRLDLAKVRLTAKYLSALFSLEESQRKSYVEKAAILKGLSYLFENEKRILMARSFLIGNSWRALDYLSQEEKSVWKKKLIHASSILAKDKSLSVETRLWASAIEWQIERRGNKNTPLNKPAKERLLAAILKADKEAKTAYERQSVISGAAYLLRKIGYVDKAAKMLKKEAKVSASPWYYYSSLSRLFKDENRLEDAKRYMALARKSVKGRATRLQWMASELSFNGQKEEPQPVLSSEELKAFKDFYGLALSLEDGFVGRNARSAARVQKALRPFVRQPEVRRVFLAFGEKCEKTKNLNALKCREHFKALLDKG